MMDARTSRTGRADVDASGSRGRTKKKAAGRSPSAGVFDDRLAALRKRMRSWGADALLVSNPRDIRYLTGFVGEDSWLFVSRRKSAPTIISDFRFDEQIAREAPQARVVMRTREPLAAATGAVVDKAGVDRLAVQADHMTLSARKALAKAVGGRRIKDVSDGLLQQRSVKSADEVKLIEKAGRIQQEAFSQLLGEIKPGMTEDQAAGLLEFRMRSLGADGVSFPTIVAAGANSSLPHAIPGRAKLRRNHVVLFDWGARYGGYCSDMTRVIAFGRMPAKLREIYQIVLDAQLAAIEAIAPGRALPEIDAVARDLITKAGYGSQFGHGLGHGIGLDIHEQPVLSFRAKGELEPGHIVTVEPGIYLPGVGGVRIEDDVLVTEKGHRVLTHLPKALSEVVIG